MNDLTKVYDHKTAVSGISLTVKKGEVFGLLGPNGAGKSTIIKMLHGEVSPTSGSVTIFGHDIVSRPAEARMVCGALADPQCAYEILTPMQNMRLVPDFTKIGEDRVNETFDMVGLNGARNLLIMKMKRTDRQRYRLAHAILRNPKALLLDEPAAGMSDSGVDGFKELMLSLQSSGKTILIAASSPDPLEGICDRVGIMSGGKLMVCGKADGILEEYRKAYVYPANPEDQGRHAGGKKKNKEQYAMINA